MYCTNRRIRTHNTDKTKLCEKKKLYSVKFSRNIQSIIIIVGRMKNDRCKCVGNYFLSDKEKGSLTKIRLRCELYNRDYYNMYMSLLFPF